MYSPHTALDSVWGGVNDWLAEGVLRGKRDDASISVLGKEKLDLGGGTEGGEGRLVSLKQPIEMRELEKRMLNHLQLSQSLSLFGLSSQCGI